MRVLVAPDKFKGTLTAEEAARAIAVGLVRGLPGVALDLLPIADGGEGTVDALVEASGGERREVEVTGPDGGRVRAAWGVLGDGRTAVVEAAAACGLGLVAPGRRDPQTATSRGLGDLLLAVADAGLTEVIVGLGGTGTNDGGAGLAQALGARLLDADGRDLPPGGAALARLDRVEPGSRLTALRAALHVTCACDVLSPLTGPEGASLVFGPQKGASPEVARALDAALARWGEALRRDLGADVAGLPGAGAAGGLGAGLAALLGARLVSGADLVLDAVGFDARAAGADLVVTGEGSLDAQTRRAKAPLLALRRARALGRPVVALAGQVTDDAAALDDEGLVAALAAVTRLQAPDEAARDAAPRLARAAETLGRLLALGGRLATGGAP
ncbi:MAG: glycerate kinase [Planctomycetes bacterium]|nr:glycerate kinase [Planctomycetota bacterium]